MRLKMLSLSVVSSVVWILGAAQAQQPALRFLPLTPCRIADTRNANGPFGGPAISGNSSRDFVISNSSCSVPAAAAAYSLNVTAVPRNSLGYLTIWPSGQQQPLVSTLNSVDGRVKANAAIVPAGTGGAISVFATDTTDVVLDINGYFVLATSSPAALAFFPLTPCRVADTRNPSGPLGGPSLPVQQARSFPVLSSSCNIPSTAQAYSLNFTAVPHGPLGFLTTWPTGMTQPLVSTLNAPTGAVTANAAIVPAGNGGAISVYVEDSSDVVMDIDGYFAPSTSGTDLSLYTIAPCRLVDTRQTTGSFSGQIREDLTAVPCGVPPSAQAVVLNATVVPSQTLGFLTLWPDGETQPLVSTLNALDGQITSNMAIVPTTSGAIDAYATDPTQLLLDTSGYFLSGTATRPSGFTPTGSMSSARESHTATLLKDGKVLVVGGMHWASVPGCLRCGLQLSALASAELFDPATGRFTSTGGMSVPRVFHTATLLGNGKVLVAGGDNRYGTTYATAELYDPATGLFTLIGNTMTTARSAHTAALLANGKVLLAGGSGGTGSTAELFDPATEEFTSTGNMSVSRFFHTATPLNDGRVLLAGGDGNNGVTSTAELFNPATDSFAATGSMSIGRTAHRATSLASGAVLITGGATPNGVTATAELFDPTTGTFASAGSMLSARELHTATRLTDGRVLMTGGVNGNVALSSAEFFDPRNGSFSLAGNMETQRYEHSATLLGNGDVFVAGGINFDNAAGLNSLATAELFP